MHQLENDKNLRLLEQSKAKNVFTNKPSIRRNIYPLLVFEYFFNSKYCGKC